MLQQILVFPGSGAFISFIPLSSCAVALFGFGRKHEGMEKRVLVPSSVRPLPASGDEKRDALMRTVRQLEAYLGRVGAGSVPDEERKWQNKLRAEMEGMKRSIDAGDFSAARRHLSGAELYVRMIELHMAGR